MPIVEKRLRWILLTACAAMCMPMAAVGQASTPSTLCTAVGSYTIHLTCEYAQTPRSTTQGDAPRIILNRAALSFKTKDENFMRVELTFTNGDDKPFSSLRHVYLAIDDDEGRNLIRRVLPHADFRKLVPGKPVTFSDQLLVGGLRSGHYWVHLEIPSADPSAASEQSQNLLLSNLDVPDRQTGLNTIAAFSIVR
jgi:hypothetical protein